MKCGRGRGRVTTTINHSYPPYVLRTGDTIMSFIENILHIFEGIFSTKIMVLVRMCLTNRGQGIIDQGQGTIDRGQGTIDRGPGTIDRGHGTHWGSGYY